MKIESKELSNIVEWILRVHLPEISDERREKLALSIIDSVKQHAHICFKEEIKRQVGKRVGRFERDNPELAARYNERLAEMRSMNRKIVELSERSNDLRRELRHHHDALLGLEAIKQAAKQSPPEPMADVADLSYRNQIVPKMPGIYFGWKNGVIEYVGMSINLQSRVTYSHPHISQCERVSWIVYDLPTHELLRLEALYIAILGPKRNWNGALKDPT